MRNSDMEYFSDGLYACDILNGSPNDDVDDDDDISWMGMVEICLYGHIW